MDMGKINNPIEVNRGQLRRALELLAGVARNAQAALAASIRVETDGPALRMEATDLDQRLSMVIPGTITGKAHRATTWPHVGGIAKFLKHATDDRVKLMLSPSKNHGTRIDAGDTRAEFAPEVAVEVWPIGKPVYAHRQGELPGEFFDAIRRVMPAMSKEERRYYLNGVFLEALPEAWDWRVTATDGHRLFMATIAIPGLEKTGFDGVIIPSYALKTLMLLAARDGSWSVRHGVFADANADADLPPTPKGQPGLQFTITDQETECAATLATKLVDGTYPDYRRVLPKAPSLTVEFEAAAMMRAVKQVSAMQSDKIRAVGMRFTDDAILIRGNGAAKVETRIVAKCSGAMDAGGYGGDPNEIGFNGKYLIDLLEPMGAGPVQMRCGMNTDPALFTPLENEAAQAVQFTAVLMPMRI